MLSLFAEADPLAGAIHAGWVGAFGGVVGAAALGFAGRLLSRGGRAEIEDAAKEQVKAAEARAATSASELIEQIRGVRGDIAATRVDIATTRAELDRKLERVADDVHKGNMLAVEASERAAEARTRADAAETTARSAERQVSELRGIIMGRLGLAPQESRTPPGGQPPR